MGPIFYVLLDPKPDRENGKLRLKVGIHEGCEGMIVYESQFIEGSPKCEPIRDVECACRKQNPIIGPHPKAEKVSCSCQKCKLKFNPYFSHYRDQVLAFRESKI